MDSLSLVFYNEAKFGPSHKGLKKPIAIEIKFLRRTAGTSLFITKGTKKFWKS
jgi:hypothetical protein